MLVYDINTPFNSMNSLSLSQLEDDPDEAQEFQSGAMKFSTNEAITVRCPKVNAQEVCMVEPWFDVNIPTRKGAIVL